MDHHEEVGTNLKRVAKISTLTFFILIAGKLIGYLYRILIARYFGPEVYGLYSLSLIIVGWLVLFGTLGFNQGLLRYVPLYRGKKELSKVKYLVSFSFVMMLCTSIFLGIIQWIMAPYIALNIFHNIDLVPFIHIFSFAIPITVLFNFTVGLLQSFEFTAPYAFIYNFLQHLLKVAALLIFIFLGISSSAVPLSHITGLFFALCVSSYLFARYCLPQFIEKPSLKPKLGRTLRLSFIAYSLPLLGFGLVEGVFYWIDSIMIGVYKTTTDVGFYNAAVPLALLLTITSELFMQIFFPLVTREYSKKNIPLIRSLSIHVGKWIALVNLGALAIVIVFPGLLINLFFGQEYLVAAQSLRLLAIGIFCMSFSTIALRLLSMLGKSKLILIDIIGASLLNVILNLVLIPLYGITGASLATMISFIALSALFILQANYFLKFSLITFEIVKIALIAFLSALAINWISARFTSTSLITLISFAFFYGVMYLALLFITRSFNSHDWEIMNAFLSRFKGRILPKI